MIEPTRRPPAFVPTLTEVVSGSPLLVEPVFTPHSVVEVSETPADPLPHAPEPEVPLAAAAAIPVDAVIDAVVDQALDRLLLRLTDHLELHIASRMVQWRNEQARDWVTQWLANDSAESGSGLGDLHELRQLVQECVRAQMAQMPLVARGADAPTDSQA